MMARDVTSAPPSTLRRALKWGRVLLGIVVGAIALIYITGAMFFDPANAALKLSGGAGAVAVTLASVAFSYSKSEVNPAMRGQITFAGARLLLASLRFLLASLYKYG